ncbi:MAG: hypothetical protein CSA55_02285 [Ilumatobacter coccineus]|uniref:Type II secretion system protein GspF domain-containing protein n=1 Tax=Ilumatobacter coccineus TaxID=467094 RepID=A0A2G6KEA2_9ACTN|nr:MAG: hypothetical protein CSA55_02285 [Ilumatobacter coccineus]
MTAELLVAVLVVMVGDRWRPRPPMRPIRSQLNTTPPAATSHGSRWRWFRRRSRQPTPSELAVWLDQLADAARGGASLNTALATTTPPESLTVLADELARRRRHGTPLDGLERDQTPDIVVALTVIDTLTRVGGPPAEPLERAAAILRERAAAEADRHLHSVQARLSAQVMTGLPLALFMIELVVSPRLRSTMMSPVGLVLIMAGSGFLLVGWWWLQRLIAGRVGRHRRAQRQSAIDALPDALELVVVGVRAGLTPSAAIDQLASRAPAPLRPFFEEISHRLHRGQCLADAIRVLPDELGAEAARFADTWSSADRYGLALGPVLDRLSTDIRHERRHLAARQARTLPVRLAFPLVVCVLPAFVLLAVAPAVVSALAALGSSLP